MSRIFASKVAIVTGGASGIGHALCAAMVTWSARVVIADVDLAGACAVAGRLSQAGDDARAVHVDVAS